MADDFAVRWSKAKTQFEETTLKKKPREKVMKLFKTSHTGLSKSLENCDKTADAFANVYNEIYHERATAKDLQKAFAKFEKAHADYKKAAGDYSKVLRSEVGKERMTNTEEKSVYDRGLKFLEKELAAIEAVIAQKVAAEKLKLDSETEKFNTQQQQVRLWNENMEGAIRKALAAAAKVKMMASAAKTPKTLADALKEYAGQLPGERGRDVVMQLVNARNVTGLRSSPDAAYQRMVKWNTKNTQALDGTATAANILAKIKTFTEDVKYANDWFGSATAKTI
jgi:hypothetical protein